MNRRLLGSVAGFLALSLGLGACGVFSPPRKPAIVILSPPPGTPFREGETVTIQSAASDPDGITRVELAVDGNVLRVDAPSGPENSFTLTQTWQATPGNHTLSVRAFDKSGAASDPATLQVAVTGNIAAAPSTTPGGGEAPGSPVAPNITPVPNGAPTVVPAPPGASCTDEAAFVGDVTIPDGTVLTTRQAFDKVWRVRNTGTCTWGDGYQFVLLSGQVMATTPIAVSATPSGATADLRVPMTAPTTPGTFNSLWRLRNPASALFGDTLNVNIRVIPAPAPPAATCSGTPNIEFFNASPTTIMEGQSTLLSWGFVSNAESATVDNGIGGVATPGSTTVTPTGTTTFTMTAVCGTATRTAQVTVTVNPAAPAASSTPAPATAVPPNATVATTPIPAPSATSTPRATGTPGTVSVVRCFIPGESGEALKTTGGTRSVATTPQTGDDTSNTSHRALLTFDIRDLAGRTIDGGILEITAISTQGNPMSLGPLVVQTLTFSLPLPPATFDSPGITVATIPSGPVGAYDIQPALAGAAAQGRARFQLRLQLTTETNGNNVADLITWTHVGDVCLNVRYH